MSHEGSHGPTSAARSSAPHVREVRIAVDVETAAEMLGVSRGALYPLVMAGDVPSFKIGRRRLVLVEALRSWAVSQADAAETQPTTSRG